MLVRAEGLHGRRRPFLVQAFVALAAACLLSLTPGLFRAPFTPDFPLQPELAPTLPRLAALPLHFEPNTGQSDPAVQYIAHTPHGALFFTPSEVVLSLGEKFEGESLRSKVDGPSTSDLRLSTVETVRLQFLGANPSPQIEAAQAMPGKVSYLLGSDPSRWQTNLPTYSGITYQQLYPGVDLAYTGSDGLLKGTYTLAPGTDPSSIRWRYSGASNLSVDNNGDLQIAIGKAEIRNQKSEMTSAKQNSKLKTQNSKLTELAPVAWQIIDGRQIAVSARYRLEERGVVGFSLGSYDPAYPLVIDPTLTYSTYLGGSGNDFGYGVAVDSTGNIYITGQTFSSNFPVSGPFQPGYRGNGDAFVTKLNASGSTMLYSVYLGGSAADIGWAVAVDGAGSAYVLGDTSSTDFPTAYPFQPFMSGGSDAFVAKISSDGLGLVYSTYLGGNGTEIAGNSIEVDAWGNAYLVGLTSSNNFPRVNAYQPSYAGGAFDAFVSKLNSTGSALLYSTYLGGSDEDWGVSLALGSAGNVYVTGSTRSSNFPTANAIQRNYGGGFFDGYLTKLSANGTMLIYSTFLGGSDYDGGAGVAVDGSGSAYVAGITHSDNFPVVNAFQPRLQGIKDAFVTKANPTGSSLAYSTYLGGRGADGAGAVAVDTEGQAHVVGDTNSGDFPLANPVQATIGGGYDGFITKLNYLGGGPVFSTYLGGKGDDYEGVSAALHGDTNFYVVGFTASFNFPTSSPLQKDNAGGRDTFVARIYDPSTPMPTYTPSPTATPCTTCPTATPTPCTIDFADVYAGDYFYQAVRYLYCNGVITGYSNNTFRPYNNTTRAQLAKIVVLAEGWPIYAPPSPTFEDVPTSHTFYSYVETAYRRGLITGYSCGAGCREYRPDNSVTRGQLCKIVVLAEGWSLYTPPIPTFEDVPTYNVFFGHIETAHQRGIITGYSDGTFRPISPANRGQISKIVYNAVTSDE